MDEITQALFAASRQGNVPVLMEIFGVRENLDVQDEKGFTPLIIAAYNNRPEAVAALLEAGADPNATDNGGNTALMGAAFKGYTEVANVLISKGADLDAQHGNGGTALMFAAMFGRNEVVDLLLGSGADRDIRDVRGMTAFDLAMQQRNTEGGAKLKGDEMMKNYQP